MESNTDKAIKASIFSVLGNLCLALIKGVAGYLGKSYALIADAIESTTDVFSSILVVFGLKYSSRPADENHPYGHGKAEAIVTFMVVLFLIVSACIIAYESVQNILTPHDMPKPFTLIVLAGIILFKELSYQYVIRKSKETNSSSLKADAWHHRSDAITSVMAFIGISFALILGPGWEASDDVAALIASGIILYNAYRILRPALGEIMDEHLYDELIENIKTITLQVPGVLGTDKANIRKSGMMYFVDLHVIVDKGISVGEGHEISHLVKDLIKFKIPEIADVLIHIEPDYLENKNYEERLNRLKKKI
ncbi:Ferrous-iron efflux pump FieF [Weeksella virosa]|uniref:cation diffusion facilitator family transporter n=1 Tax=Weeksella virosa TaxID=1014 RepID=UPI000DF8D7C6|nr:cation diffusion facilitator family transporter [Weeksella virosa]SUP53740.1 Ferrous-iron efflux pump FieF [Weeksella virosa]